MFSMLAGADYIDEAQNKRRTHKKGSKASEKFNGFTTAEALKLGRKPVHLLTRKERLALELYWNARLATMGETVNRGYNPDWLTYEADIMVLDFFAEDSTYAIPQITGERLDK